MGPGWHVERRQDAKGRRVIADRAFHPGEAVLDDEAFAWAPVSDQLGAVCSCCLAPLDQPLRCSACKLAWYASREHQARAWRAGHRQECAALRACAPRLPPTAVRLALRCALHAARAAAAEPQDAAVLERYAELLWLQHHWEALPEASKLQFAQMGALAHQLLAAAAPGAAERPGAAPRELALLIARFGANSHTISDGELRPLAVGIFPLGAMVNHDCCPNTVHTFRGSRMLFRAVRPIQAGEEVTTAYTELAATRWERRRELLWHHQFDVDADEPASAAAGAAAGPGRNGTPGAAGAGAAGQDGAEAGASGGAEAGAAGAEAAATSAAAVQQAAMQAGLQCMPPLQPATTLLLAGSAAELRLYGGRLPPWRYEDRDVALTDVVLKASSGRRSSSWGGMWGCLRQADSAAAGADASFDVGEHAGGAPHSAAGATVTGSGTQPPAAVVHCWSPELQPAAASSQQQQGREQLAAAEQLAQQYTAALQLQATLDGLLSGGHAAAAARQLHHALEELSGRPSERAAGAALSGCGARLGLGPRHVLRMRLLADLHRAALAASDWGAALSAAYDLLPLYEQAYQPVWPQVGLLWAAVAKLEHLVEQPSKALAAAEAALRILSVTHGGEGPAAEEARRVQFEAAQELRHGGPAALGGWGGSGACSEEDE